MPEWLDVRTQEELENALRSPEILPVCVGDGRFTVSGSATVLALDAATISARDSAEVDAGGSATVEATDSTTVLAWRSAVVRARDLATVGAAGSAVIEARDSATVVVSGGRPTVTARGSTTVDAGGFAIVHALDSASVKAWGSAIVYAGGSARIKAWESAMVRAGGGVGIKAWGSAIVEATGAADVEAWDSATVLAGGNAKVKAWSEVLVHARGRPVVEAGRYVTLIRRGRKTDIEGGVLTEVPEIATPEGWCDFYGVEVNGGVAVLYKAVDAGFRSHYGMSYEPESRPQAPDWDGGESECGGGLHFSPRPCLALEFMPEAKRYVACPVRLDEMVVHGRGLYRNKVKAKGVCAPVYEVDEEGKLVDGKSLSLSAWCRAGT